MIDEVLEDHPTAHNLLAVIDSGPCPPFLPAPLRLLWRPLGSTAASSLTRLVTVGALRSAPATSSASGGLGPTNSNYARSAGSSARPMHACRNG